MSEPVRTDVDDRGVATLTLQRPEVRNAFDPELIAALHGAVDVAAADAGVRAVVLTGSAGAVSAGADVGWMRSQIEASEADDAADAARMEAMYRALYELPKPLVCRVDGPALGGGAGLVVCGDVVVATDRSVLGFPEVRLGLAPARAAEASELQQRQWNLDQVRAPTAWTRSTGAGVTIAIIDSGVDLGHPDLAGKLVPGVTTFGCPAEPDGCGDGDWRDGEQNLGRLAGHGTHVAALAAGTSDAGAAGVAPSARVLPIKALSSSLGGTVREVAAAVRAATARGADVINLSLGVLPGEGQLVRLTGGLGPLNEAIREATDAGAVVIAASGNEAVGPCAEPAFDARTLCAIATDRSELPAWYSNAAVDEGLSVVSAPGGLGTEGAVCPEEVLNAWPRSDRGPCRDESLGPSHAGLSGTSMAAPHLAGVVALLRAQGRSPEEAVAVLQRTARTPGLGRGV
jgi:serine protease